ncbi:GNAT family N-acetyltransferase [Kitasatospora sp. NPDC059327]|uniref:GNAT family N-acetyltransferase n=1 Tax=Kitasatospora sp. NPDC059327 TaxID=3346803 RepID=UPI00367FA781
MTAEEIAEDVRVRLLAAEHWDEVVALEARTYGPSGLSEGRAALQSRARVSPATCFAVEHRGRVGGYLLALPYPRLRCPDLSRAEVPGARSTNIHLHDLVIAEELRGRGLARLVLAQLTETARARRFATVSLVAVLGSEAFWAPLGYRADRSVELPASYGAQAVYMSMPLRPGPPGPAPLPPAPVRAAPLPPTAPLQAVPLPPAPLPAARTGAPQHPYDPLPGSPLKDEVVR